MMSISITPPEWKINGPPIDACLVYNQQPSWTQRKPPTPKHTHTRPRYAKKKSLQLQELIVVVLPIVQQLSLYYLSSSNRAAHNTVFLSLRTTCPPAAENIFFNQHAIVGFSLVSRRWYISGLVHLLPALIPLLSTQAHEKKGVWHSGYQLPARSQPQAQSPENLPTSLPLWILKILSWERGKNCQDGRLQYMFSPALSYPTMPLCLEWLSG